MSNKIQIVPGPSSVRTSRDQAERKLRDHPKFPKGSTVSLEDIEGRWIAAISAAPPFGDDAENKADPFAPDGPDSDDLDPKEENPFADDSDDSSDDDSEDKDKKDDSKSEKSEIKHLTELVNKIVDALGIGDESGDPEQSEDPDDPDLSPDGPPPPPPSGGDSEDKTHRVIEHQHALKPGETPPGGTPLGAPSFSNVQPPKDHPWHQVAANGIKEFHVESPIGEQTLSSVNKELSELGQDYGYRVTQIREGSDQSGRRTAKAIISR